MCGLEVCESLFYIYIYIISHQTVQYDYFCYSIRLIDADILANSMYYSSLSEHQLLYDIIFVD